jgi:hypothetical protein
MFTDNGIDADLDAIREVIDRADVLTIAFTPFAERLLVDTRSNATDGPACVIVDPVGTVQERYQWLGRHRGSLGAPEAFSFVVWPKSVRNLIERQVLRPLRERLAATSPEAADMLDHQLARLAIMEQQMTRMAVRGEGPWKSLWVRAA